MTNGCICHRIAHEQEKAMKGNSTACLLAKRGNPKAWLNIHGNGWGCFSAERFLQREVRTQPQASVGIRRTPALTEMKRTAKTVNKGGTRRRIRRSLVPCADLSCAGAFFARYARRAAARKGKLACTDVRIFDGQRTASDVVTSWAEEGSRFGESSL